MHRRLVICTQPAFVSFFLFFWLTKNEKKIPWNARGVRAAWPVVHAQCMPCVKTALVRALGSTSAAHMSVPSCPTRRCPPRAPQLRQHACYYQLAYVYMLCMCLRCHSSSLFIHQWHAARVAPRRRRRDIWCEPYLDGPSCVSCHVCTAGIQGCTQVVGIQGYTGKPGTPTILNQGYTGGIQHKGYTGGIQPVYLTPRRVYTGGVYRLVANPLTCE